MSVQCDCTEMDDSKNEGRPLGSCIFINAFAVLTMHTIALVLFRYIVT